MWFPHKEIGLANGLWPVGLTGGQAFGTLTAIPFVFRIQLGPRHGGYMASYRAVITLLTWLFAPPPSPHIRQKRDHLCSQQGLGMAFPRR